MFPSKVADPDEIFHTHIFWAEQTEPATMWIRIVGSYLINVPVLTRKNN
jgi:hypothetical protein